MSLINEALKRAEEEKLGRNEKSGIALVPVQQETDKGFFSPFVLLAMLIFLIGVGMMTWTLLLPGKSPFSPDQAEALVTKFDAASSAPNTEQEAVLAQSMDSVKYYNPSPNQQSEATSESLQSSTQNELIANSETTDVKEKEELPQEPSINRQSSLHPSAFKVSAIILGADGATAIINGKFLKVGSIIDGATVTEITQYSVVLERNGKKITIQI